MNLYGIGVTQNAAQHSVPRWDRMPQEQEMVKREIESRDHAIDKLVYELYGVTEEEIRIVEGGA